MRVMVVGGDDADCTFIVSMALDRLSRSAHITGILRGPDEEASEAAFRWWQRHFFAPVEPSMAPADIVVILPGVRSTQRFREAQRQPCSIVFVTPQGELGTPERYQPMPRGEA